MARYQVSPIATAACASLNQRVAIIQTDNLDTANWHSSHNSCVYGAGILDRETGLIDVGFGFGNPVPADLLEGIAQS